jgi:26S proteasome regulatory subunit N1
MAILLGRHQIFLEMEDEKLAELNSNVHLHQYFRSLARELDIMEPKTPEAVYKAHLETGRPFATQQPDVKRQDLAASFVNGFVNCGFGVDKMLGGDGEAAAKWFQKNKEYAVMSAAASMGLIHRWDVDNGLTQCDPFLSSEDEYIRVSGWVAGK